MKRGSSNFESKRNPAERWVEIGSASLSYAFCKKGMQVTLQKAASISRVLLLLRSCSVKKNDMNTDVDGND
jgi:hypothetical protein